MAQIKANCDTCGEEVILYENKFRCKNCKLKAEENQNGTETMHSV